MPGRIFTISLFLILLTQPEAAGLKPERNVIVWYPDIELIAGDFQQNAPETPPSDAQSWTGVEFSGDCWQGEFTYEVYAIFHRDSSWLAPGKATEQVLHHEKIHFDISEIYARKLRKALSSLVDACGNMEVTRAKIDSVTRINQRALTLEQKKFDRQTRHGSNIKKQIEWEKQIRDRLAELAEYIENPFP
jgi:hypothetical protein